MVSQEILSGWKHYTNNNPNVILAYYIRAGMQKNGCPQKVRSDMGTFLAGERSFSVGTSITNQRIEAWWGFPAEELYAILHAHFTHT